MVVRKAREKLRSLREEDRTSGQNLNTGRIRTISEREEKNIGRVVNARDRRMVFHHSQGAAVVAELGQTG
jgi:hypothetical protein